LGSSWRRASRPVSEEVRLPNGSARRLRWALRNRGATLDGGVLHGQTARAVGLLPKAACALRKWQAPPPGATQVKSISRSDRVEQDAARNARAGVLFDLVGGRHSAGNGRRVARLSPGRCPGEGRLAMGEAR
jgi:hypothetical protein